MSSSDSQAGPPLHLVVSRSSGNGPSDAEVVRGLVEKHEWAAATLWTRYGSLVYRMADRALGSPHEAEDLTQDVFLCVFDKVRTLRDPNALRSFIVSVTIRIVKWRLRRKRLRQWVRLTDTGVLPELPGPGADADESLRRFYRLLDKLSVEDRLVFVLRRVDGMRLEEVAQTTGHSLATVKRRLVRCDAELARWIERDPILMIFLRSEGGGA